MARMRGGTRAHCIIKMMDSSKVLNVRPFDKHFLFTFALGCRLSPGRLFHPGRHTKPEMDYIFVCENKLSVLNESRERSESLADE